MGGIAVVAAAAIAGVERVDPLHVVRRHCRDDIGRWRLHLAGRV